MTEYKAKLKTVEKWEKNLKVKLSKDLKGDFVTKIKRMLCTKHVESIKHRKTFIQIWIDGSMKTPFGSIQIWIDEDSKTFESGSTQKSQRTRAEKTTKCRGIQRESGERCPSRKRAYKDGKKRPRDFTNLF